MNPVFGRFALGSALAALALASIASTPVAAKAGAKARPPVAAMAKAPATGSLASLIKTVDIPYESFTLANGLRVLVHTDRKAPIVGVTVYYRVGSKNEPKGKTGFAHLFEHLMFSGSENVPSFDEPLTMAGGTNNGSTWYDRTNYVETVPTGALDLALFLEADRMGHLLGAITQTKLDAQRAVVQNEKRQSDNQPFGLVDYATTETLFPADHPYGHDTIGSMADLDAASLDDVKNWFRDNYAPNNAILVLAGDIDVATARAKVEKLFGAIPAGPKMAPVTSNVPTLKARVDKQMKDRVAATRLYRVWTVPGLNDPDVTPLSVGAAVLGGLASSRLDNALVRKDKVAVAVTAHVQQFEQMSQFEVTADVRPGVDPALVGKKLDALIAEIIAKGPTQDEVTRVVNRTVAANIAGLEVVGGFGGKASTLAEGLLYSGDPAHYKKELAELVAMTPAKVKAALQKWISRPVFALRVDPGERDAYAEALVGAPGGAKEGGDVTPPTPTIAMPQVQPNPDVDLPTVQTASLSNGIKVHLAQRTTIPAVQMVVSFDAGTAADPKAKLGIGRLMLALLDEGTKTRNSIQIAEAQERLGATIGTDQTMDRTTVSLFALKANLAPSLDLLADVIRNPAFAPSEVERIRATQLAGIAAQKTQPAGMAGRAIMQLIYGKAHPYGVPSGGIGDSETVKTITDADLHAFHQAWLAPGKAEIFIAGNASLAEMMPLLEARFGKWAASGPAPTKDFSVAIPAAKPGIFLIDRPQSPQSYILGAFVTQAKGSDDLVAFKAANTILGDDSILSRLDQDIRETRGWSYGVRGYMAGRLERSPYIVVAPVQADQTGPAIAALRDDIVQFLGPKGVTAGEFNRVLKGNIAGLPAQFETTGAVLGQMQADAQYGRPFDYVESLGRRYAALTPDKLDAAARAILDPAKISWVVVGDKAKIEDQLKALGLPVTQIDSNGDPVK